MGRKKKRPNQTTSERSARFIEMAKQIQAEDAEKRFEEAMKRISQAKKTDVTKRNLKDDNSGLKAPVFLFHEAFEVKALYIKISANTRNFGHSDL